jgi:hypothetical protein
MKTKGLKLAEVVQEDYFSVHQNCLHISFSLADLSFGFLVCRPFATLEIFN